MRRLPFAMAAGMALILLTIVFSCAPVNLYTITMMYLPEEPPPPEAETRTHPVTVARFIDARNMDDTIRLGTVVRSDGSSVPVHPKYRRAVETVTDGIKACLSAQGYSLSLLTPSWDLNRDTIDTGWGNLVIGGSIDRLAVICRTKGLKKTYETEVVLTCVFADVRNKRIIRTMETRATSSLTHVRFSEALLGEQISTTLSQAIRQVYGNEKEMKDILDRIKG